MKNYTYDNRKQVCGGERRSNQLHNLREDNKPVKGDGTHRLSQPTGKQYNTHLKDDLHVQLNNNMAGPRQNKRRELL